MRHAAALLCAGMLGASVPGWSEEAGHPHRHEAPHGGTLLVFGDEVAHLELVLERDTGELRAYVLDGAAQRGVPVSQPTLELEVAPPRGDPFPLQLEAVENVLTGEVVGRSSEFGGRSERLVGLQTFGGVLRGLEVKGRVFRDVRFRFPEGNEHASHHEGEGAASRESSSRGDHGHEGSDESRP